MDVIDDQEDGLLVPFGDIAALAEAIARLVNNPSEACAMGERGRTKALTEHTWDRKYPYVRDLYLELVADNL
jgi:glycosyltransferase involved in cell wall biosynthesis